MNAGYLRMTVALWIVALVAGGYAGSYSNRPTTGEMDNIVLLGTECILGVNERCLATQFNPPFVKTNSAGWYLDTNAMATIATNIRSFVPCYVTNAVSTNIVTLTFTGLLSSLNLGDGTNFTCTPATGTNAATYGDYPDKIYIKDLQERYKVLYVLTNTLVAPAVSYLQVWRGEGKGATWAEAYTTATGAYAYATNLPLTTPLDQHCKGAFWSNLYSDYIPGEYTNTSRGTTNVTDYYWLNVGGQSNWYYTTNLVVTCTNYASVISNISVEKISAFVNPGWIAYTPYARYGTDDDWRYYYDYPWNYGIVAAPYGTYVVVAMSLLDDDSAWIKTNGPVDSPVGEYTPYDAWGSGVTNAIGDIRVTSDVIRDADAQPSCAGLFTYIGTNYSGYPQWQGSNGYYIYYADTFSNYVIFTNLIFTNDQPFFWASSPAGSYAASNHIGNADASESLVQNYGTNDCDGHYYDDGSWYPGKVPHTWSEREGATNTGWEVIYDGTDCLITKDGINGWKKEGSTMPNGTYAVIVGTGFYGTVGVSLEEHKVETNVVVTNTWGTNTVFYQCWLTKTVWTNAVYASSNIEHRVSYDIYAVPASIASNNSWDDEGTGWTNSVWSRDNTDGWGWDTNASASLGGDIATPPDDMAEPAVANQTYASGWRVTDSRGVLNWRFLYATNNLE